MGKLVNKITNSPYVLGYKLKIPRIDMGNIKLRETRTAALYTRYL